MVYGLLLSTLIAVLGEISARIFGFNALLYAIIYGVLIGNMFYQRFEKKCCYGIEFAKKTLLRTAIVFYGFNLTWQQVSASGLNSFLVDFLMLMTTFILALWAGKKLGLERDSCILIGSGSSICGAAAVLGAQSVIKSDETKVAMAVATVVIFGTISMFLYPMIFALKILPFDAQTFGVYIGASVHEVAQVVAAGGSIGATDSAIISKMTRVLLLAPFLFVLAFLLRTENRKVALPYFALGFVTTMIINSVVEIPFKTTILALDKFLLAVAMAALGLTTHFKTMKSLGMAPFKLAGILFLWLLIGGSLMTYLLF